MPDKQSLFSIEFRNNTGLNCDFLTANVNINCECLVNYSGFEKTRVTQEHRERHIVSTGQNEYDAEITGNLRFAADSRADFPAVGDWVTITIYDQDNRFGYNPECRFRIAEEEVMLTGDASKMKEYKKMYFNKEYVPKALEYLISDLINKKDQNNCISLCKEAFNKYPDSFEILNKYAWVICTFRMKEDYGKALEMVQKSISINPERAGTYSTEAWIYFEMGDRQKAIQFQNKAIELYPNSSYIKDLEMFKQ